MPQYDDLVRRAVLAGQHSETLQAQSRHICALAQALRDARSGRVLLTRCAWCGRLKVEEEWLHLTAIGEGQQQIASSLCRHATHGICPSCLNRELEAANRRRPPTQGRQPLS